MSSACGAVDFASEGLDGRVAAPAAADEGTAGRATGGVAALLDLGGCADAADNALNRTDTTNAPESRQWVTRQV